ncbi:MAG: hypothetical protein P8L46_14070 [Acidimicrobiales bacterium]|nr:hypothetical protein [Acidimicrobiales bacterium]MDG2219161.1 hypothetical protein [Acidimicrobiales bacterium]
MIDAEVQRELANQRMREASVARALSNTIAAHRDSLQNRLSLVMQCHTGDVWLSRAASDSRFRVRSLEVATLARVTDDLDQVGLALERRGRELEDQARTQCQYADGLEAVLAGVALGGLGASGFA